MSHPIQKVTEKVSQGEVPSNRELHSAIDTAEEMLQEQKGQVPLNTHGKQLVYDAEDILESAKKFIDEKNQGDKLQKLVQHGKEVSEKLSTLSANVEVNPLTPDVNREAMATFNSAKKLAYYALNSKEFRTILLDMIEFVQDLIQVAKDRLAEAPKALQQDLMSGSITSIPQTSQTIQQAVSEIGSVASSRSPRLDELDQRLAKLVGKMQSRPELKDAKDHIFILFDKLGGNLKEIQQSTVQVASKAAQSEELSKLWFDLKDLTEGFAGKESVDHLMTQMNYLLDEFRLNPKAGEFWLKFKSFVNDIWENPKQIQQNTEMVTQQMKELLDESLNILLADQVQLKFSNFLDVGNKMLKNITSDLTSQEFLDKLVKFTRDFALDSQNRPSAYVIQDSLIQLKNLLLPIIKQQVVAFKIPYIHHSDEVFDLDIAGLDVHLDDILPHQIEIKDKNFVGLDISAMKFTEAHGLIIMKIKELKAKFSDVEFKYTRKAIPTAHDEGLADIDISQGKGIYIKIIWKITSSREGIIGVSLDSVKCNIDKLKLRVKHSRHNLLENFAATLFSSWVQQKAAESIVNTIIDTIQPYNETLNDFFKGINFQEFAENANKQLKGVYEHGISIPSVGEVVEQAKSTIESAKQAVTETVEKTMEKASETIEEVKRPFVSAAEQAKEYAEQAKEYVEESMPEVAEKLSEVKEQITSDLPSIGTDKPITETIGEAMIYSAYANDNANIGNQPLPSGGAVETATKPFEWYSSYESSSEVAEQFESISLEAYSSEEFSTSDPTQKSFAELLAEECRDTTPALTLQPEFPIPEELTITETTIETTEVGKPVETELPSQIPGTPDLVFQPEHTGAYEVKESPPMKFDTSAKVDIKEWDGSIKFPVSQIEDTSTLSPHPREREQHPKSSK